MGRYSDFDRKTWRREGKLCWRLGIVVTVFGRSGNGRMIGDLVEGSKVNDSGCKGARFDFAFA